MNQLFNFVLLGVALYFVRLLADPGIPTWGKVLISTLGFLGLLLGYMVKEQRKSK